MTEQILAIITVAQFIAMAVLIFEYLRARRNLRHAIAVNEENKTINEHNSFTASAAAQTAQQFINAAKLISIHSSGRLRVLTFARGDQTFTIETMGLLSDNVPEWKRLAGLTE